MSSFNWPPKGSSDSFVSVLDFGAVGDGVTDDTSAISSAIASLSHGGSLYFPAGTYCVSSVITVNVSNILLFGVPEGSIIQAIKGANNQLQVMNINVQSGVSIDGITFDANQSNRTGQSQTWNGFNLDNCTDCLITRCTFINTLGFSGSATALAVGGTRIRVSNCTVRNCGIAGTQASDAFYNSGTQILVENCTAYDITDTGFVLEQCNYSGIMGCTVDGCGAGAAIDAYQSADAVGNFINGLSIFNWNGTTQGALLIGTLGSGSGNLLNTTVSNVTMQNSSSINAGIYLIQGGSTGYLQKLSISNCVVNMGTAGDQALVISGKASNVSIAGCQFNSLNSASTAIQLTSSAAVTEVSFIGNQIITNNTFAMQIGGTSGNCSNFVVRGNIIDGQSAAAYGIYCSNSATGIDTDGNTFVGAFGQEQIGGDSTTAPRLTNRMAFSNGVPAAAQLGFWNVGTPITNTSGSGSDPIGWTVTTAGVAGTAIFTAWPTL